MSLECGVLLLENTPNLNCGINEGLLSCEAPSNIFSGAITDAITLERENKYQMAIDGLGKIELDVH